MEDRKYGTFTCLLSNVTRFSITAKRPIDIALDAFAQPRLDGIGLARLAENPGDNVADLAPSHAA
jgi:hypothetical protein